jgi:hypothetical protein
MFQHFDPQFLQRRIVAKAGIDRLLVELDGRQLEAYYDDALRNVGVRVPAPLLGQPCNDYRRETLRNLKRTFLPQNHDLYKVQYRKLPADALAIFEPQLLAACVTEANNPAHLQPGEIRKVERLDETGRVRCIDWVGRESFVKQMTRPGRRVLSFTTDRGRFDASGRALR